MRRLFRLAFECVAAALGCGGWMFVALILLNSLNPFLLGFLADCSLRNDTDQELLVTLVSTPRSAPEDSLARSVPPLYTRTTPTFPLLATTRFALGSGETLILRWEWDDYVLSEVLVETPDGRLLQNSPAHIDGVITDLSSWLPASPHVRSVTEPDRVWWAVTRGTVLLLIMVAMVRPLVWLARRRRLRGRGHRLDSTLT